MFLVEFRGFEALFLSTSPEDLEQGNNLSRGNNLTSKICAVCYLLEHRDQVMCSFEVYLTLKL